MNECRLNIDGRASCAHCRLKRVPLHQIYTFCRSMEYMYRVQLMMQICGGASRENSRLGAEQHRDYFKILNKVQLRGGTTAQKSALMESRKLICAVLHT